MSWDRDTLEKARAYELTKQLSQRLSVHYPWLLNCTVNQVLARLAPVRHTPDGRMIRFFGIDCHFPHHDEAAVALFLLKNFMNATGPIDSSTIIVQCDLPAHRKVSDVLKRTNAYEQGVLGSNGEGLYGWKVPQDEIHKPPLIIIPAA